MSSVGVCTHGRVRTLCALCRNEVPRAPRQPAPRFEPPAVAQHRTETQRNRSDAKIAEFVEAMLAYVEREKNAAYARYKDNLQAELAARVQAGRAIEGVEIVDLSHAEGPADWAAARCTVNMSKFRMGSSLLLHRGDVSEAIPCRLLSEGELSFRLGAEFRQR